jgi:hypothetical protein
MSLEETMSDERALAEQVLAKRDDVHGGNPRADETGHCYRASGWREVATVRSDSWHRRRKAGTSGSARWLPGFFTPTTEPIERVRWECQLTPC